MVRICCPTDLSTAVEQRLVDDPGEQLARGRQVVRADLAVPGVLPRPEERLEHFVDKLPLTTRIHHLFVVGLLLGYQAVAGLLMVGTIAGVLLATTLNNGGGAWDKIGRAHV